MYICVCNALPEQTVRTLAREGMSFEEIQAITGCSNCCGSCKEMAETVVAESRGIPMPADALPIMQLA